MRESLPRAGRPESRQLCVGEREVTVERRVRQAGGAVVEEGGREIRKAWRKGVRRAAKAPTLCELSAFLEQCEKSAGTIRFPFCLHI